MSGNSLRQTVHTHCASVHQAAKLVAALLRVAGVTAGLAESNGSLPPGFMTHVTCRLPAKNRDQYRNPTLGNRVWATFTFRLSLTDDCRHFITLSVFLCLQHDGVPSRGSSIRQLRLAVVVVIVPYAYMPSCCHTAGSILSLLVSLHRIRNKMY